MIECRKIDSSKEASAKNDGGNICASPCIRRYFLHADMDAFFASVEQKDNPALRGKPLIIGSLPGEKRGVVSTASYEARKYGVHSAMPIGEAYRLCPNGVYMHPRMDRYHEVSDTIMGIFNEYSPDVLQMSIDEALIDLTGTERLFGEPVKTAMQIKQRVKDETGLTISAGLASNGYVAKIASEYKKPDGFFEVKEGDEEAFMLRLPLKKLWGVGSATLARLKAAGLNTASDVHNIGMDTLKIMFGNSCGEFLYNAVRGREAKVFMARPSSHSISSERTFDIDIASIYAAETAIMEMCHTVAFRMRREKVTSRTVVLKLRYGDFETVSVRDSSETITSLDDLYMRSKALFERKYERHRGLRLIGVGVDNTQSNAPKQRNLFTSERDDKREAVEKAIAGILEKEPSVKIQRGRTLDGKEKLPSNAPREE